MRHHLPGYAYGYWTNLTLIGQAVSKKKIFEIVDGRRTDARAWPSYKLTLWAFGSGELKIGYEGVCPFLAHLSRRLTSEPIRIGRHPASVRRRRPRFSKIFSSETPWPIKAKF